MTSGRIESRRRAPGPAAASMIVSMPTSPNHAGVGPRLWLAGALVAFALVSLTVGAVARDKTIAPGLYPPSYLKLFFSDPIHLKVWLATAATALACFQLVTAAHVWGRVRLPGGVRVAAVHRWSGRLAILLTLPVAYHCIFLLGYGDYSTRVQVHSLLGSTVYGAVVAKVLIVRGRSDLPGWALPAAGGVLFAILLGLWLTSSLWFFRTVGVGT
jgi:Family of unknown function (DUF6529)